MSDPKSWALIFTDVVASDRDVLDLGEALQARAAELGFEVRPRTVEAWRLRARERAPIRFQESPKYPAGLTRKGGNSD